MPDFEENAQLVASVCNISLDAARKFLNKHGGDIEKAVDGALNANRDDDEQDVDMPPPLIDLTTDPDEEYRRAIQLSMESSKEPKLVPSNRAPHPEWQLVRSNTPANPLSPDEALKQALRASLEEVTSDEDLPLENSVREAGRPVALRANSPGLAYAALLIHALFNVPQIRKHVASLPLPSNPESDPTTWKILETFTNLDLAQTSMIHDSNLMDVLHIKPLPQLSDHPGEVAITTYTQLASLLDNSVAPPTRLCTYATESLELRDGAFRSMQQLTSSYVSVELYKESTSLFNELISQLSASVLQPDKLELISEPSEVIAFQLKPPGALVFQTESTRLRFPKSLHLDQFLVKNANISSQKRRLQKDSQEDIQRLQHRLSLITRYKNRDTIKDLEITIHYYEHLASGRDDPERLSTITKTLGKLQGLLTKVKDEVKEIEAELSRLQTSVDGAFESSDLQQHAYDLRCVLMYTGVAGRKNIYSYVKGADGRWWKTVDRSVTEVPEETVLADPAGHRLSAGPFMLIYSRATLNDSEPIAWPSVFADTVNANNRRFLESLPSELLRTTEQVLQGG